jgi:hypothetical protein
MCYIVQPKCLLCVYYTFVGENEWACEEKLLILPKTIHVIVQFLTFLIHLPLQQQKQQRQHTMMTLLSLFFSTARSNWTKSSDYAWNRKNKSEKDCNSRAKIVCEMSSCFYIHQDVRWKWKRFCTRFNCEWKDRLFFIKTECAHLNILHICTFKYFKGKTRVRLVRAEKLK